MNDLVGETLTLDSGYITPPLSPSKTVSTEGWLSPRTPESPRKTRSCHVFRDIGVGSLFEDSPGSSAKVNLAFRLGALQLADVLKLTQRSASPLSDEVSPTKARPAYLDGPPARHHIPSKRSNSRSLPITGVHLTECNDPAPNDVIPHATVDVKSSPDSISSQVIDSSSNSCADRDFSPSFSPSNSDTEDHPMRITSPDSSTTTFSTTKLRRLPLRQISSPLRPSQWVARGGLLSSIRRQVQTSDRFIPSRGPPNATRESFEINNPTERLIAEYRTAFGGTPQVDPFSRRLHRSGRLNDELHRLRDTNLVLMGRASSNRRGVNSSVRRRSSTGTRQISAGAVWNVGGSSAVSDTVIGVSNGRGGMLGSGTNAPLYTSMFLSRSDPEAQREAYERRLALALDVDQTDRILEHSSISKISAIASSGDTCSPVGQTKHVWRDSVWIKDGVTALLDAPQLRDDYYCSLLSYSHTSKCLAVGLGNFVHLWSERKGVDTPESLNLLSSTSATEGQHVTSLAFSSTQGGQAILAVGRADGRIALWSPFDEEPRFDASQPKPISYVSFRPTIVRRTSLRDRAINVPTEELLIGDEIGNIYFYSIEWPPEAESALFGWNGAMTLLVRMTIHTQQICGLSWSIDGELFASGGNDNACYLFETKKVLHSPNTRTNSTSAVDVRQGPNGENIYTVTPGHGSVQHITSAQAKHKWELNAAVKAIAFCPWQRGLLAVGGGSNDRCIHFYHTMSGACLASIDCAAQITSLIWSQTKREIAATFGFAQPEHPYRIAVFAWPSCEQVVAVPWFDENRALYAVAYPGGPESESSANPEAGARTPSEDGVWWDRSAEEGCIVVAASDAAIRFHEIWTGGKKGVKGGTGLLGGSDILESLHGIDRKGDATIR